MHLPTSDEQEWLIDRLHGLVAGIGSARFLSCRVVLPNDEFFPDRWEPNAAGVSRIAGRLLAYAGMQDRRPSVALWRQGNPEERAHHVAAFFLGFDGDRCLFGVDSDYFDSPDLLVGTMAHEVAHAFRAASALVVDDRTEEELLTDLTAVHLGFGVLLANGSYEYRSYMGRRGDVGNPNWSTYEHRKLGYLPYQAVSFALAVQVAARGLDPKPIRRSLSSAQRQSFDAAMRNLQQRPLLRGLLGLGRPPTEAAQSPQLRAPEPAPAPEALREIASRYDVDPSKRFRGQDVYVWFDAHTGSYAFGALGISLLLAIPLLLMERPASYAVVVALAAALGWRYGRTRGFFKCATCGEILAAPDAEVCTGCGGTIRGRIRRPEERLSIGESR